MTFEFPIVLPLLTILVVK